MNDVFELLLALSPLLLLFIAVSVSVTAVAALFVPYLLYRVEARLLNLHRMLEREGRAVCTRLDKLNGPDPPLPEVMPDDPEVAEILRDKPIAPPVVADGVRDRIIVEPVACSSKGGRVKKAARMR